jgi:F0F1-type ATP synthase membrane subunit c/vacuolar-type H+-ATPase subunit K
LKLAPLIAIEVAAFLLIIGETYFFFTFVVPLGPIPHSLGEYTGYALLKVVLTVGLGALWFLVMIGMTRAYVRSKLRNPTPTPSS